MVKKAKHFEIYELVGATVYDKYGEQAWRFLDPRLIDNIDWVRENLGKTTVNTWYWGGRFDERGLRDNTQPIFKGKTQRGQLYLSGHVLGMAADFDIEGMTAQQVREWIIAHKDELPHPVRFEWKMNGKYITWVHMDVEDMGVKIYKFDV